MAGNALMIALMKGKGKASSSPGGPAGLKDDEGAEPKPDAGTDYKQVAKDAAKDGDWDAMIDAICGYVDAEEAEEADSGEA